MKPSDIKELLINSLNHDADPKDVFSKLENEGVSYDFRQGFSDAVLLKIFPATLKVTRDIEFVRYMYLAFKNIAISGVAAIILLLISIFLMEGSISFDSFLGLKDNYAESIICLLIGK
jgi:hypothetical protein